MYSQLPLMDRHNRGELRKEGEKTEERKEEREKDLVGLQRRRGRADEQTCTHTFSGGDVNRAGDVGEALVHAHLQVDHPAKQPDVTQAPHHCPQACTPVAPEPPPAALLRILQSTRAILALSAHKTC